MRPDGSAYRTYPDVFVYPRLIAPDRGSVTLEVDGPPVLIIEVLSESTHGVGERHATLWRYRLLLVHVDRRAHERPTSG